MTKREFTAIYQKHGKWVSAWIEELPGVNTQGHTKKEARENLKEALQLILETNHALALGKSIETSREPFRIMMPVG